MPNAPARLLLVLLAALACALAPAARAQVPAPKEAPASVEGRVTEGDEGLPGVAVLLNQMPAGGRMRTVARARTDHEGRYRMHGVPPGRYQILPAAPVFVLPEAVGFPPGRTLVLSAGDAVSDMDFRLTRGGVITGRVTDADGQPVVGEQVQLTRADKSQQPDRPFFNLLQRRQTDDRGIYRIYGLEAGSYRVSVGQAADQGSVRTAGQRRFYRRTFHPDATEESQARVVEVAPGAEVTNVDITLGRPARTYTVAGRVVGPDGRPAPGVTIAYGPVDREQRNVAGFSGGPVSNARGEFQLAGVVPGSYAIFVMPTADGAAETYSDAAEFTVSDADVSGLEVKLRRGASVGGVVQVEGASDRAAVARILSQIRIMAHTEAGRGTLTPPSFANVPAAPDGSFRLTGLRPGRLRLGLGWPQVPGVTLTRVEVGGVEQREGFELAEGAQVSNVRLVVAYGSAVVRGQVNVTNGTLTPEMRLVVFARRVAPGEEPGRGNMGRAAQVDARGRFILEGLPAGDYELSARVFPPGPARNPAGARQQVSVPEGGDVTVTLTLDLSSP